MKIIYCIHSIYNPGGMERVLLNKVQYWTRNTDWEVVVVTTDQNGRPAFYPFPKEVRLIDLGINYSEDNGLPVRKKITGYLKRRSRHRRLLTDLLMKERADIVVSLYPSESSFIPSIKDGSKKVLELHYCKYFRIQYGRTGVLGMIDRFRTWQDKHIASRFDKFVVLSEEDKGYWGHMPNLEVIPNAAMFIGNAKADMSAKRVIAVGRYDYQKGFDRLIDAWNIVKKSGRYDDWRLDFFGQGEWRDKLQKQIEQYGLQDSARLNKPTSDIGSEYARSSMLVMSSNYEGFPMVMIEAMASGLPVVSFDFKCGPKDIIQQGQNGLIVSNGDIDALAEAMMTLMESETLRRKMSGKAAEITSRYSEQTIMDKWTTLFDGILK